MLPPWLNISPFDYLRAVQAGTQAGLSIREANERAFENAQRMEMERERQQQAQQQLAVENAENRLAQERLEAYRQGELKNAQARLGIEQQGLALRGETASAAEAARNLGLDLRERSLKDTEERNKEASARALEKLQSETKLADLNAQLKQAQLDKAPKPITTTIRGKTYEWNPETKEWTEPKIHKDVKPTSSGIWPFNLLRSSTATNSPTGSIPLNPLRTTSPFHTDVAAPPPSTQTNEIIRVTKDGRRAIFDADTKKFIRYAE